MASSFDGPSQATGFNPSGEALVVEIREEAAEQVLPPESSGLTKTAEAIGGTVGKVVHAGRSVYTTLDSRHKKDMSTIHEVTSEAQRKAAAISSGISEFSENVVGYFRTHNASDMAIDLERTAKRYPVQALTIAAAAGFLLERALLRRRY